MKIFTWIISVVGIIILGYIIYVFFSVYSLLGVLEPTYSKKDLIKNYELKSKEINDIKKYVNSILPKNKSVFLEFNDDETLGIFQINVNDTIECNYEVKIDDKRTLKILQKLGWKIMNLRVLKNKLDKANCISVASGAPFVIGYQRSGMGMYFYNVFDKDLSDSLTNEYNDGCRYIHYKKNIVLEYGGGSFGSQCFEKK